MKEYTEQNTSLSSFSSGIGNRLLFENKILWTIDDLIAFTGLAKQTVYNKVSKGEIPSRKRWGKLYFVPEEIINMIEHGDET